jgi:spore germination protein PE
MWANLTGRTSYVHSIHVDTVGFSSIIQLGDSTAIQGFSRALAVQREAELFYGNEGNFSTYPVFFEPIPLPPITENLSMQINNRLSSCIKVNDINIIGVSSSSLLHIGNSETVQMEVRIKHIRQLLDVDGEGKNQGNSEDK